MGILGQILSQHQTNELFVDCKHPRMEAKEAPQRLKTQN